MHDARDSLLVEDADLAAAIRAIDAGAAKIALVVGADGQLVGTITDGDVRRAILAGANLDASIGSVMNQRPITAPASTSTVERLAIMRDRRCKDLPIVDDHGRPIGIVTLRGPVASRPRTTPVVLFVGGLGTRLRPLTDSVPKPMLTLGTQPILERIIERFVRQGFTRFFLSVSYRAEKIMEFFGDGARWGAHIDYLREDRPLGTAGALGLLPEPPTEPMIVMNGDVLTKVDFGQLVDFHVQRGAEATLCVREHQIQVPFGTVTVDGHTLVDIKEKPTHTFLINAGIYVLGPKLIGMVSGGGRLDMPELFIRARADGHPMAAYPIYEYWLDIGQLDDFYRAQLDVDEHFP